MLLLQSSTNPNDIDKNAHEETISVYEPGRATEMLAQSVLNLNIEHDRNGINEFKVQAGKILSGMLESRLNEMVITQSQPLVADANNDDDPIIDTNGSCVIIDKLNTLSANNNNLTSVQNDNNNLNGMAPLNKPKNADRTGIENASAIEIDYHSQPIDLPPPPTLAELSEHINDPINHKFETIHDESDNPNDTRNTNDKTESTDYSNTHSTIDGFSAKLSPVQPKYQQHHCQTQHHPHPQTVNNTNGQSNSVVFRNKNTKPELTTHARDRRSYIEKDNFNQNRFPNHNNNSITSHTTEIVSDLRDGKHPICSVCHTTITRSVNLDLIPNKSIYNFPKSNTMKRKK